jgi:hypothetical protein
MCLIDIAMKYLDTISKSAIVFIATLNLFFAIKFFNVKTQKDDVEKEADRKIQWLKSLILDHNLEKYYLFFDELDAELNKLKNNELSDEDKQLINGNIAEKFVILRRNFTDMLLAVDNELYNFFIKESDQLQDHITEAIFDAGINLSYSVKYNEVITERVMATKTGCIKKLFGYRG